MVNDLQLISSMCSAYGNALHVATAWKNRLVMDGGLVGGFLCVRSWWGGIHSSSLFRVGGRELRAVSVELLLWGPFEEPQPFGTDSIEDCDLKRKKVCQLCLDKSLGVSRGD